MDTDLTLCVQVISSHSDDTVLDLNCLIGISLKLADASHGEGEFLAILFTQLMDKIFFIN